MASVPAEAAKVVIKLRLENIFLVIKSILRCVSKPLVYGLISVSIQLKLNHNLSTFRFFRGCLSNCNFFGRRAIVLLWSSCCAIVPLVRGHSLVPYLFIAAFLMHFSFINCFSNAIFWIAHFLVSIFNSLQSAAFWIGIYCLYAINLIKKNMEYSSLR